MNYGSLKIKTATENASNLIDSVCIDMKKLNCQAGSFSFCNSPDPILNLLRSKNLLCPIIPADYGGRGFSCSETALLLQKIGMVNPAAAYTISTNVHAVLPLLLSGSSAQKNRILPDFIGPTACLGAFACTEQTGGSDLLAFQTVALQAGGIYKLNGNKDFVLHANEAKYITTFAYTKLNKPSSSLRCFIFPSDSDGIELTKTRGISARLLFNPCQLFFNNVSVDRECVIKDETYSGLFLFGQTLDIGRILASSVAYGIACKLFQLSYQYANSRLINDEAIYKKQAVSHPLVDLRIDLESTRLLIENACEKYENGEDYSVDSSMAKLASSKLAIKASLLAESTIGARSFLDGSQIDILSSFARIFSVIDGTDSIIRNTLASIPVGDEDT